MTLLPAFLDELRARVPLSPLIARRVKLTRAGREYKGCCPFHNEKTPSFYVNDDKGFYHCFGCGAHGDVIRFLTDAHGLPFMEAVKQLAAEAGMEVPSAGPEAQQRAKAQDDLASLTERAAQFFAAQLAAPGGADARAYVEKRGLRPETVRAFALGFAPDNRTALMKHMNDAGPAKLLEAGLIGKSDSGETFDRFRGRLMFPIRDRRGRVVGFGGRALGDIQPKYLNSADGPLFDKGRLLYNLDRAGPAGRKAGRIIVVEGYMDVIALAQAGIAEAVAPLGTAMTEAQLALAWRVADEPILCFDGDAAGQRAATRAAARALPLLQPGKSLRIATLPMGQDPDDLVRAGGAAAFEAVLNGAVPLIDHLWASETAGLETATPERRAAARARLREAVGTIADPAIRALYLAEFNARFAAAYLARPERKPWQPRSPGARWQPPVQGASAALKARADDGGVLAVLKGLLLHPHLADAHEEALMALAIADPARAALRDLVLAAAAGDAALAHEGLGPHIEAAGLAPTAAAVLRAVVPAFSFCRAGALSASAVADFGAMVEQMAARARIEAELAEVTRRLALSLSDADFERQKQLVDERLSLDAAMMRLAESQREG